MSLSFDSCILIDVMRGRRPDFRDRILDLAAGPEPLHLSAIVHHELMFGVFHSANPSRQQQKLSEILQFFEIEDWTQRDAEAAAKMRATLRSIGRVLQGPDALIAGQALARGWDVVTVNIGHFSVVPGLSVIDWTAPLA